MIDKWFKKNHMERMTDKVSQQAILKMVSNMKGELTQRRTGPLSRTKNLWDKTKTLKLQAGDIWPLDDGGSQE